MESSHRERSRLLHPSACHATVQAQRARFAELGARLAERTRQLRGPHAVDEHALLKAARQTAETAPLLEWLRLLASAYMQVRLGLGLG